MIIEHVRFNDADAQELVAELRAALLVSTGRFGAHTYVAADAEVPRGRFVIARATDGTALGCGAIRPLSEQTVELKRMYARPGTKGVGAAVLEHLEDLAREFGYDEIKLETGYGAERAIAFYQRNGYAPIDRFGEYVNNPDSACFGKTLGPVTDTRG